MNIHNGQPLTNILKKEVRKFTKTHWGSLKVFQAPCSIFQRRALLPGCSVLSQPSLMLSGSSLAILLVLYEQAKNLQGRPSEPLANVTLKTETPHRTKLDSRRTSSPEAAWRI